MNTTASKLLVSFAEKAGKTFLKEGLKEYGGESGQKLGALIFGESKTTEIKEEIRQQVNKISEQLVTSFNLISKKLDLLTSLQLLGSYTNNVNVIICHLGKYNEYIDKSLKDDINKRNVYKEILYKNSLLEHGRALIIELTASNVVLNTSVLEYFADKLLNDYTDVFDFSNQLDSLVNHARYFLVTAIVLERKVREEAEYYNSEIKEKAKQRSTMVDKEELINTENVQIAPVFIEEFETFYFRIINDAKLICSQFDECQNTPIMLQHLPDEKFLTGYMDGSNESNDYPFVAPSVFKRIVIDYSELMKMERDPEKYISHFRYDPITGTPQIFLDYLLFPPQSREKKQVYVANHKEIYKTLFYKTLEAKAQRWKLIKKNDKGTIYFMFQHQESGLVLDGISDKGKLYLSKLDDNNHHLRWQPIITKHPYPYKDQKGYFILRHLLQRSTLDSNGSKVYAGEPVDAGKSNNHHENIYLKWRLVTDTLFSGEYLEPGQNLLSMSGKISLTYNLNGVLIVFDRVNNKELWISQRRQQRAWRCYMQKDCNFVTYAEENVPTWASNTRGEHDSCRLIVKDSGEVVISDQYGKKIWSNFMANDKQ
ncbi:hypothetical protein LC612_27630 [Nostoc sp. CHAB 5834]|nr:hypothetical protein [Nostoc sp. CHAB 5834]